MLKQKWSSHFKRTQKCLFFLGIGVWVFSSFFLFVPFRVLAVGISPALIIVDNVSPNSEVRQQIFISRGDASKNQKFQVVINGQAASYVYLPQGDTFEIPAGRQEFAYPFILRPGSLAEGTYEATFAVRPMVEDTSGVVKEGAGAKILTGAQATIRFSITNKAIESYVIQSIAMTDTEEEQALSFTYLMENTGNVDTRPKKIEFIAVDETDPSNVYKEILTGDQFPFVQAFSKKEVPVLTKAQLKRGLYSVQVLIYNKEDKILFTSPPIRFQVFPKGTLAQEGTITSLQSDKKEYQQGELVKLVGVFQNTGSLGVTATMAVDMFLKGQRIDALKSEPLFIVSKKTGELDVTFRPPQEGNYEVTGYMVYGPHKTHELHTTFRVGSVNYIALFLFLGSVTLLIGGVLFWLHRRHKRRLNLPPPPTPSSDGSQAPPFSSF